VGTLFAAIFYIFFVLPKKAFDEAKLSIQAEIHEEQKELRSKTSEAISTITLLKAQLSTALVELETLKVTKKEYEENLKAVMAISPDRLRAC